MSTYILLKDLPDSKAGDRFRTYNDDVYVNIDRTAGNVSKYWMVEGSGWFKKEDEPIKVNFWGNQLFDDTFLYNFNFSIPNKIDPSKLESIKRAIESIVNEHSTITIPEIDKLKIQMGGVP